MIHIGADICGILTATANNLLYSLDKCTQSMIAVSYRARTH